ncbi:AAA family ATPase [Paenibacillus sp. CC-CFT747]|nr:AAA family ATPase [Paenibacillus sp. CC-CFT747]
MEQLEKALERANVQYKKNVQRQELLQPKGQQGSSQVITVYSGKGGSGATFLASNLAQTLALNSGAKVLLVDLNMQFGGLHQLLDVPHDRNLGDLKSVLKELTFSQLNNVLYRREDSPLSVLLSPAHPQDAENFGSDDIELLLTACRQHFDLIVLDVPKELNEVSISAISQTDLLLYVLQLDRPSIVRMQQVYNILERYHLVKDESVALVVNRFSKKNDVTLDDLQKMTLFPVWGTIADGMNGLQQLVNLGQLLHTKANDKGPKGPARDMYQLTSVVLQKVGGTIEWPYSKSSAAGWMTASSRRNRLLRITWTFCSTTTRNAC